jgi:hypothetical protein
MTCTPYDIRNAAGEVVGGAIVCTRGRAKKQPPCKFCPSQPAPTPSTRLCDGKLADGRSCDKPMCEAHAKRFGAKDLCPSCWQEGRTTSWPRPACVAASPTVDRVTEERREIRGLTLHRPWSWCISHAGKRVENRDWPAPPWASGNFLAVHGGKTYDEDAAADLCEAGIAVPAAADCPEGIVAVCQIADCVTAAPAGQELWFSGPYGWVLANVVVLADPVPCRGAQGLWRLPPDVLERVRVSWRAAQEVSHG